MTTAADIKRVTRLVREREPRLVYYKRLLILPPVGHYLRAFILDQTSTKEVFRFAYFVQPLYQPTDDVRFGHGDDLFDKGGRWSIHDPRIEERVAHTLLGEGMEKIAHVDTPEAFLEYSGQSELHRTGGPWFRFLTFALMGRLDEARREAEVTLKYYLPTNPKARHTRRFLRLFEDGPDRAARVLRTWEEMTVRRIGIARYWQSPW
jgi:hypothetical protein